MEKSWVPNPLLPISSSAATLPRPLPSLQQESASHSRSVGAFLSPFTQLLKPELRSLFQNANLVIPTL